MGVMTEQGETIRTAILTVDDDPGVSRAVARDLRRRYGLPTELPVSYRQNSGGDLFFSMTPGSDTGADRGPAFPECWRACCGAAGWPGARLTCRAEGVEVAGAACAGQPSGR